MKQRLGIYTLIMVLFAMSMVSYAITVPNMPIDEKINANKLNDSIQAQPELEDEAAIPDSLLNPRWKLQLTTAIPDDDLN